MDGKVVEGIFEYKVLRGVLREVMGLEEEPTEDEEDKEKEGGEVVEGILEWFTTRVDDEDGKVKLHFEEIVKEIGVGLLAKGGVSVDFGPILVSSETDCPILLMQYSPRPLPPFTALWSTSTTPFSALCSLSLLSSLAIHHSSPTPTIQYYPPSLLSPDPATRFAELFAVRPKWREVDMVPFLDDLVGGEKKERDKLVMKFVRKVKVDVGVGKAKKSETVWSARNLW